MQLQTIYFKITDQEQRIHFKYSLLLAACFILILSSCDDSFQPLKKNDKYFFSIFGFLDVSADTQWVRVGTVRESIDAPPAPDGIQVILEDLQSGETIVMKDSVFSSRNVLNYWTTMNIKQEQTYSITVQGSEGKTSQVMVTTPTELPTIFITINDASPVGANIYIDQDIEHIADVQSVWYVTLKSGTEYHRRIYRFPLRNTLEHSEIFGDSYAFANWEKEQEQIEQGIGGAEISRATRQFFVATGGPEWDSSHSAINDLEFFLDGTNSNIENGLGYVVGINSGWFWQAPCLTPDQSNFTPCKPEEPFWK